MHEATKSMIKFSIRTFLHRISQVRHLSHKMVDFIVIGAQKSGTSSLRYFLELHPDIRMSYTKEPHFFDGYLYSSHPLSYYWYEKDFYQGDRNKRFGEVTPILSYLPDAPKRIHAYNPDIKLIMLLRNPIDRAYSHWKMERERGNEDSDFLYCIKHEQERLASSRQQTKMYKSYVDRGYYSIQVKRLKELFRDEQLLFVKYEDYVNRQETTIRQILNFLEVSPSQYQYQSRTVHKRSYRREITREEKEELLTIYSDDISRLEELLEWDCSDWRRV